MILRVPDQCHSVVVINCGSVLLHTGSFFSSLLLDPLSLFHLKDKSTSKFMYVFLLGS